MANKALQADVHALQRQLAAACAPADMPDHKVLITLSPHICAVTFLSLS